MNVEIDDQKTIEAVSRILALAHMVTEREEIDRNVLRDLIVLCVEIIEHRTIPVEVQKLIELFVDEKLN